MGTVPDILLRMLGLFNPLLYEVTEMLYEFNQPFVVDSSKFVQAFGDISTPYMRPSNKPYSGIVLTPKQKSPSIHPDRVQSEGG